MTIRSREKQAPMGNARQLFDTISTGAIAACALTMVVFYVRGQVAGGAPAEGPVFVQEWEAENALGVRTGPANAPMVITKFLDFTCPYCQMAGVWIDEYMQEHPGEVALVVQHFTLGRPQSFPSAVAAECADRQGRFYETMKALYAMPDSFGVRPWESYAEEAGVPNLTSFIDCISLPADSFPRIAAGKEVGERHGVRGTPTIWINGHPFEGRDLASLRMRREELGIRN